MRFRAIALFAAVTAAIAVHAQPGSGFSGTWKLNPARSEIGVLPSPPDPILKVEQSGQALNLASAATQTGAPTISELPLDGKQRQRKVGTSVLSTTTKWEGSALLVNTVVSGPQNYSIMERWRRSRDGNVLTITRTIVRISGESESTLVYENAAQVSVAAASPMSSEATALTGAATPRVEAATPSQKGPQPEEVQARVFRPEGFGTRTPATDSKNPVEYVLEPGTRILLRLTNAVNTKGTAPGDAVYLETAAPVFVRERLVIPPGSFVKGVVTESERAGRVKGRSALNLAFEKLTLPNGVTRDFRSRAGTVDSAGNVERSEGRIRGEGNKGGDARTVGATTAAGAGIGGIAGGAAGAGIGAAIGAAAGLAGILGTRGKDVTLPAGTTMELVLDRELRFEESDLP